MYALPSPNLSKTWLNTELGLGDETHNNAFRARKAASRPAVNTQPAPTWLPKVLENPEDETNNNCIASVIATPIVLETFNPLKLR